ncbi:hypothetical protein IGI04_037393 [Brassica rapa subsp. trilocularis]|uniref:Uncharacterized protein n=1 Tax=Brassica rapa subsp. trilocularis TaxID=1813537 RepID=A0ABQ7LH81_BRACM|nr:hypothetical protein IGI04_037393 [Brassica rapa subsp. trilocularis]
MLVKKRRRIVVHTDVRVCPSAHTGRPWPSVSTHRTSGCPSVHISARSVDCSGDFGSRGLSVQYTQDVRQHTRDVRGCPCVRQCTQDVRQHTQDVRQHTQDVRGCPCVSVCPSVHTGRPSAHTERPSAHAGRPSATQDVRGCPCVSVCPSAHAGRPSVHTGRPSAHKGRPCPSVSTQRTSVAVRQHTQDVRQYTEDIPGHPSAHTGRPSAHAGRPCVSVCLSVHTGRPSAHTGRPSVHTGRPSAHTGRPWSSVSTHISMLALPVDCSGDFGPRGLSVQYTQDVRQHTQDVRACPLAHTDCPWTDQCTELISAC